MNKKIKGKIKLMRILNPCTPDMEGEERRKQNCAIHRCSMDSGNKERRRERGKVPITILIEKEERRGEVLWQDKRLGIGNRISIEINQKRMRYISMDIPTPRDRSLQKDRNIDAENLHNYRYIVYIMSI